MKLSAIVRFLTVAGEGSSGSHLSLVTLLLAGDSKSLCHLNAARILPLAKRVLLHTLRGVSHAHMCGVVHTDLKPENISVSCTQGERRCLATRGGSISNTRSIQNIHAIAD
jgi:serine/threonine protein kinase